MGPRLIPKHKREIWKRDCNMKRTNNYHRGVAGYDVRGVPGRVHKPTRDNTKANVGRINLELKRG